MSRASSVSSATTSSTSPLSTASANRPTSSRSRAESGSGARSRSAGSRPRRVARARCRAPLTEAALVVEHLGDLGGAKAEHVVQHERGALARRQLLKGDDERELDRLPGLVKRGRPGALGPRCPPAARRGRARARARPSAGSARAARGCPPPRAGGASGRAARSGSDSSRSGRARSARRIAPSKPSSPLPRRQERLLDEILGVLKGAEDPVAMDLQLAAGTGRSARETPRRLALTARAIRARLVETNRPFRFHRGGVQQ